MKTVAYRIFITITIIIPSKGIDFCQTSTSIEVEGPHLATAEMALYFDYTFFLLYRHCSLKIVDPGHQHRGLLS